MGSFSWNSGVVYGTPLQQKLDGLTQNPGFRPMGRGGSSSSSSSLILDSEKGELVRAPERLGKKEVTEAKALAALKSHSEAERRRRERINAHLNTLRSLVSCTDKMDKASVLAVVIDHVKELKRTATEASKGFVIPMDVNEVIVEPHEDEVEGGSFYIKASLCCEDRPEILPNLRQALEALNLKTVRAEISTLGGRMKNVFVMTGCKEENVNDAEVRHLLTSSVCEALRSVLDNISDPPENEFSPRTSLPNKRRRISLFDSSSSSS